MAKDSVKDAKEGDKFEFDGESYEVGADVVIVTDADGNQRLLHKSATKENN